VYTVSLGTILICIWLTNFLWVLIWWLIAQRFIFHVKRLHDYYLWTKIDLEVKTFLAKTTDDNVVVSIIPMSEKNESVNLETDYAKLIKILQENNLFDWKLLEHNTYEVVVNENFSKVTAEIKKMMKKMIPRLKNSYSYYPNFVQRYLEVGMITVSEVSNYIAQNEGEGKE